MNSKLLFFIIICFGNLLNLHAQAAKDYAVQVEASFDDQASSVTLHWVKIPAMETYTVYKRNTQNNTWKLLQTIQDTFYQDSDFSKSLAYEYKIEATGTTKAYGYIYCGQEAAPIHHRGTLILVVDTLFRDSCSIEIATLMDDIRADGWAVKRLDFNRSVPDKTIKTAIKQFYNQDKETKAVLILGHVAVPYSGNIYPDGHTDHQGAWPADIYYGDMDGLWTDNTVNNTVASREENKNIPNDGKWDQSTVPSKVELQVSRIDFHNMPQFGKSEVQLMRQYLNKLHLYKTGSIDIIKQGIVDDNFGGFSGEAFASTAWRNFAPLLGRSNILEQDFITSLNASPYQWAYGCGGGSYTTCSGIGKTADFATKSQKGIFTILFGSYFGDWNSNNNILRAPLCSDEPALISFWAGRPHWYFHPMALGEHIGAGLLLTQNNYTAQNVNFLPQGYLPGGVHVALLGDLTLRSDYLRPARDLKIKAQPDQGATIQWQASEDADVLGYYVYRSDSPWDAYEPISELVDGLQYLDTIGTDGYKYYMVRPSKLETNPSGSYYNLGLGIIDSAYVEYPKASTTKDQPLVVHRIHCYPNPTEDILHIDLKIYDLESATLTYKIVDTHGKLVTQGMVEHHHGEVQFTKDIATYQSGLYFIEFLVNAKTLAVQKFFKL